MRYIPAYGKPKQEVKEPEKLPHFCLKCGIYMGDYIPLTEEEKDMYNTIQLCVSCFYQMYPQYRMTDEQWERIKQRSEKYKQNRALSSSG